MKIGKYEFLTKEQAETKIKALGTAKDENGNEYTTHNNTIVELGYIVLEQGEYDEEGNVIKEAVLNDKYSVDVLWNDGVENVEFNPYRIELDGNGSHSFYGIDYQKYKL
tara:strand:- start:25163 stop:25489 length:327 start_codon:yes stop_codon:yes gene_type:complete